MELLFVFSLIISLSYVTTMSGILMSWLDTPTWQTQQIHVPNHSVSVIIAIRNEESYIRSCIHSIEQSITHLHSIYPDHQVEIIVIDDHSDDNSLDIIETGHFPHVKVVSLPDGITGKKAALHHGIKQSSGDILVMTDGDCIVPPKWLATISSYMDRSTTQMITSLVTTLPSHRMVAHWQYLDLIGMMAVTAHGIYAGKYRLANGANLAIRRSAYDAIKLKLSGHNYASGDDVFLAQTIHKAYPGRIQMLKSQDSIVHTQNELSWSALLQQRKRWASKTKGYEETGVLKLQGYVWAYSLLIIASFLAIPFTEGISAFTGVLLLMTKMTMDYLLLSRVAGFFEYRRPLKYYVPVGLIHLIYILWAGLVALAPSTYLWKDRHVR